jgi:uncharacterized protein DUF4397
MTRQAMNRPMTPRAWATTLVAVALLSSCDWFEKNTVQNIAGPVPAGARIRFFNFGVGSPPVNFYADNRKMTAIGSVTGQESNLGVAYGGVGAGGFYTSIAAGSYTLAGKIAAATDKDLAISNVPGTLAEGKLYSFYQSGIYDAGTKSVDAFVVEDNFVPEIDYTVAYVRFVHAISNANPLTLYATKTAPPDSGVVFPIGAAVAYKGAGAFTALAAGTYNLGVRYTDSTTNKISRPGVALAAGKIYTITARGNIAVTPTTTCPATSTTCLDNTANR